MKSTQNRIEHNNLKFQRTYQSVFSVQIKNCEPFVFGPEFAMDKVPTNVEVHITVKTVFCETMSYHELIIFTRFDLKY